VYPTGIRFRSANRASYVSLESGGGELTAPLARAPSGDSPAHLSLDSNESKD
jgi:hypothetical protein